jgi:hypothetical protein
VIEFSGAEIEYGNAARAEEFLRLPTARKSKQAPDLSDAQQPLSVAIERQVLGEAP